jgi:beta-galactosidase
MLDEQGTIEKTFSASSSLKAAAAQTVTLAFPWPDARRWDLAQPNLYTLQLAATGVGLDDEYPQEFGFREFWVEDSKFFLNGTEFRLRPARLAVDPPNGDSLAEARKIIGDGCNFGEYRTDKSGYPEYLVDFDRLFVDADRAGLPCSASMPTLLPLLNPAKWADPVTKAEYQRLVTTELRRLRNHPSVLVYNVRTDILGNGAACAAIDLTRAADPTRPVFTSEGTVDGGVHAVSPWPNLLPLQEFEESLNDWARSPFSAMELGEPLARSFLRGRSGNSDGGTTEPFMTEWCAAYLGRSAYATEPASYREQIRENFKNGQEYADWLQAGDGVLIQAPAFQEVERLFLTYTLSAWRTWGISGGMLPGEGGQASPETARYRGPTLAWIAGPKEAFTAKDHSFAIGQPVSKTLVLINDRRADLPYTAEWKAEVGEVVIGGGTFQGVLKTAQNVLLPIEFDAPTVSAKSEGRIMVTATIGPDKHQDAFAFRVFPGPSATVLPPVSVFDPAGETTALLKALGYTIKSLKDGDALPEEGILIVGRRALSDRHLLPESVPSFVRNGGRLLVMGQDPVWIERSLGLRIAPRLARRVFRIDPNDLLFAGLDDTDLRDWSGSSHLVPASFIGPGYEEYARYGSHWGNRGALTSTPIEKPHRGSWRPILETEFDLAYTPLMEMEYGRGRITLCTLDLEDYFRTDPAAKRLAENLLEHVTNGPLPPKADRTLYIGNVAGTKLLDRLGVRYERASDVPTDGEGLLVLSADANLDGATLTAFLDRGGRALVLSGQVGTGPLEATYGKAATFAGSLKVPDWPEVAGLSPSDLRWRTDHDAYLIMPGNGRETGADNLLARKIVGKGVIVYCQIDPDSLPADEKTYFRFTRWRQTRALSQILSNLGATFVQDDRIVSLLVRPDQEHPGGNSPSPGFYHDDYLPDASPADFPLADDPYRTFLAIPAKDSEAQEPGKPLP